MIVSLEKSLSIVILAEEINMDELSVVEYLNMRGIMVTGHYFNYDKNINKKDIVSQVNLIVELHKCLKGCKFSGLSGIRSTIGKEVESYKVQIRKLQKHYDYIFSKPYTNEVEKFILLNGGILLKQAKESINYIYGHDYLSVIKRSMNREEICIGKVDKNNLRENGGKIEVGTIKGITYNLIEEDLYIYIKKLQRKEFNIDEEELVSLFVHGSHLSFNSIDYLKGLCTYPKDFFRIWEKYRDIKKENINKSEDELSIVDIKNKDIKKEKTEEEILLELKRSLKYEGRSFIG
jgi:hypothetical protein